MKNFKYTVTDPAGVHARPAGMLVKEAQGFSSKITIIKNGQSADLKRILGVMSLGIKKGQEVEISAEGEDEESAASAIEKFMKENL